MPGERILVIDDEPAIHRLIRTILEREGFKLVGPDDEARYDNSIKTTKPDLIILDLMMPEVSGFDILEMLKKDEDTMHIPVIVLTVRTLKEDVDRALELGAECFMAKPFEPSELVEAVQSTLYATPA